LADTCSFLLFYFDGDSYQTSRIFISFYIDFVLYNFAIDKEENKFKKTHVLKFRYEFNLVKEYFVSYKFL